jgi:uncharacterized protein YfaP (DUF2135 family)
MQKRYNSNQTFMDFIQIVGLGFIVLFLIAFMLINPVAKQGKIDPVTQIMINATWDENVNKDIDLWVRGPDGRTIGFNRKDGEFIVLDRDDLGKNNDTYEVNGEQKVVKRNIETTTINAIVPGEYVINIHYFGSGFTLKKDGSREKDESPEKVKIDIIDIHPFKIVLSREVTVSYRQEVTVATFIVNEEGNIEDLRTDVNIKIYRADGSRH